MKGLMMDYQLTLPTILRRAEALFGEKEIVSRLPDKSIHRYTYFDFAGRTRKLAATLRALGVRGSQRVATLCWNHYQHLECYFAVPCIGAIVHPLNVRLSPEDLAYLVNHAEDSIIIVDEVLLPLLEKFKPHINVNIVIVIPQSGLTVPEGYMNYESLVASGDESKYEPFEGDEHTAAFMCYTSGTTGRPKGVLYSHRSIMLHSTSFMMSGTGVGINERDVVLPVVPMFHACAWGFPYLCAFAGAKQVFPGPNLDPESILFLFDSENVTVTGGVPTVWLNVLRQLDADPNRYKLTLRSIIVGGSSAPGFMVKAFDERYNVSVLQTWGMTELSPLGSTAVMTSRLDNSTDDERHHHRLKAGLPVPFVEIRGRNEQGLIPWDGVTMGELEVRGPWVASGYYHDDSSEGKFTSDGWFRTGDIVSIGPDGSIEIRDRSKDVVKSGGEWISSVALENSLMSHPLVHEAAVIAIPDEKWMERPFAYVVVKQGFELSAEELRDFLSDKFARFWIPEGYAFIEAIPKTSVGKILKSALREMYAQSVSR